MKASTKSTAYKVCNTCSQRKPIELFYKHKQMSDGRLNQCKKCKNAVSKAWVAENKDKSNAHKRKWDNNNKERSRECKDLYKVNNREKHLAQKSAYAKANREKYNSDTARYRAQKLKATPVLSELDEFIIEELYDLAGLRQKCSGVKMHVDHEVPLVSDKVCGLHNVANLRIITAQQNQSKNNRHWENM